MLYIALALTGIGVLAIFSASPVSIPEHVGGFARIKMFVKSNPVKQLLSLLISVGIVSLLLSISYMRLKRASYIIYGIFILTLIGLFSIGKITHGARRWIDLGFFNFQPSEFMKLALIIALARYMMYKDNLARVSSLIIPVVMTMCPMALIILQPDLGTALLFFPILIMMLLVAGARIWHLALSVFIAIASMPLAYFYMLKPYQQMRIQALFNTQQLSMYEGYQLTHSKIAIGTGGLFGKGWSNAMDNFVPESHTDFVFAVICEEWGFIGAMAILLLFLLLLIKCVQVGYQTREPFGRLLVVGIITYLMMQVYINLGMTIGLAPVTGLTLPFVSYGGSSLLLSFVSLGIVMNVEREQTPSFAGRDFGEY